mmetsp:Transcript_7394/g.12873  ORF Transcript_7394/g.12873 Transcript_7394/m.12873 type:complete len:245 (-) Transcript_7394:438-1172(-)
MHERWPPRRLARTVWKSRKSLSAAPSVTLCGRMEDPVFTLWTTASTTSCVTQSTSTTPSQKLLTVRILLTLWTRISWTSSRLSRRRKRSAKLANLLFSKHTRTKSQTLTRKSVTLSPRSVARRNYWLHAIVKRGARTAPHSLTSTSSKAALLMSSSKALMTLALTPLPSTPRRLVDVNVSGLWAPRDVQSPSMSTAPPRPKRKLPVVFRAALRALARSLALLAPFRECLAVSVPLLTSWMRTSA